MRRYETATTVESTPRQAKSLGRFLREVGFARQVSKTPAGSGAPPGRSRSLLATAALIALVSCIAATAALASPPRYEIVKQFGPDGTGLTEFSSGRASSVAVDQQSHAVYVLDAYAQKLYKFDDDGTPVVWGGSEPYISGNELSGLPSLSLYENTRQVAVDSTSHTIYVTGTSSIVAFQADGEPAKFSAGPAAGTNVLGGFLQVSGVAVDTNGYIYASDLENSEASEGTVSVFAPSGEPVVQFDVELATNVAVDTTGAVYVTQANGVVSKFTPSSYPVTAATTYSAVAPAPFAQDASSVGIDPITNSVYVPPLFAQGVFVYAQTGALANTIGGPGADGELTRARSVAAVGGSGRIYIANAESSDSQVHIFQPEPPSAPTIELKAVGNLANTSATLYARINPGQKATTYRFAYGLGDCAVSLCTTVPTGDGSIAAGNDGVWVSEDIQGLNPDTEYHYMVIAENDLGSDQMAGVFTTQVNGTGFQSADGRAWEMVSPPKKHGGLLLDARNAIVQAAADGNGIAYPSYGSLIADPEGMRELQAALAHRDTNGWRTQDITPPSTVTAPLLGGGEGEYKLFSPDLSKGVLDPRSNTPLSSEASERAPYLRDNSTPPSYTPLVTGKDGFANVPPGTQFGGDDDLTGPLSRVIITTATHDLSHVVVTSFVPLVKGAPSPSLYEWTEGQLRPISVLPEGEIVSVSRPGSGTVSMRHAISEDGSRVFWQYQGHLYMRDLDLGSTNRLDQVQPGIIDAGDAEPVFQGASADGSAVFFTDSQRLTEDSGGSSEGNGKFDLYRCDIVYSGSTPECQLHDLTPKVGSEVADVQGVVPAISADGKTAYFVAKGVLATNSNQYGQAAVAGNPNLYVWERGGGVRFIATLDARDRAIWGTAQAAPPGRVADLNAGASPSGRYFAFTSASELTDQGNIDPSSGEPVVQVFRYDVDTGQFGCISCSPNGAAPNGKLLLQGGERLRVEFRRVWVGQRVAAVLPEPALTSASGTTIYQPRMVLDNGRVFFNASDSLVPADSNRQWDVYQYEPTGAGDCSFSSGASSLSRSAGGCVSLISSGTAEEEAAFSDASETGDDVFFLTSSQLNEIDEDHELDVYDARVNGVPATLPPQNECLGEACQAAARPPNDATPASAAFRGAGNVHPKGRKRCGRRKHLVRRNGHRRCVANHRHHRRARPGWRANG